MNKPERIAVALVVATLVGVLAWGVVGTALGAPAGGPQSTLAVPGETP